MLVLDGRWIVKCDVLGSFRSSSQLWLDWLAGIESLEQEDSLEMICILCEFPSVVFLYGFSQVGGQQVRQCSRGVGDCFVHYCTYLREQIANPCE